MARLGWKEKRKIKKVLKVAMSNNLDVIRIKSKSGELRWTYSRVEKAWINWILRNIIGKSDRFKIKMKWKND